MTAHGDTERPFGVDQRQSQTAEPMRKSVGRPDQFTN